MESSGGKKGGPGLIRGEGTFSASIVPGAEKGGTKLATFSFSSVMRPPGVIQSRSKPYSGAVFVRAVAVISLSFVIGS